MAQTTGRSKTQTTPKAAIDNAKRRLRVYDEEEAAYVEMRLSLARLLGKRRESLGYTQARVASLLGSSQSRVAKMEAGDPSVSIDLMIRSLLKLGASRRDVGKAIAASPIRKSA